MFFFFFNDTATTEIYTLSLHDALPIFAYTAGDLDVWREVMARVMTAAGAHRGDLLHIAFGYGLLDRKSTRLNSSHLVISYAVFCLKKKKIQYEYSICVALYETCKNTSS